MGIQLAKDGARTRRRRIIAVVLACAVALSLAASFLPTSALAYYTLGTVSVTPGASYLSVQAGLSTSTSVSVNPASDDQTLGCGMAQCPQVCGGDGAIEAGYSCFDANGQCTCAGTAYSTYYPEVSVVSSNSGVASAYVSGGTLVVMGNSAGSATITVTASLRQWNSSSSSIQVNVTEPPAASQPSAGSGSGSAPSSTTTTPGEPSSVDLGAAGIPAEATVADSRDDALNEQVVETVTGAKVYTVERNSHLDTAAELSKIAGTGDQCIIWSGTASDNPDYSWTFHGDSIDADSPYLSFDPAITVSELGTGSVANIMKQAESGVVLEFSHEGQLPGTASIYVRVGEVYGDGTTLSLYRYDTTQRCFVLEQEGIAVEGGYASFEIDHCSTWALSSDDLAAYAVEEVNTPGAVAESGAEAATVAEQGSVVPYIIGAAAAIVVVAVVAGVIVAKRRKTHAAASDDDGRKDAAADGASESEEREASVSDE